jgi:hypothetical protein
VAATGKPHDLASIARSWRDGSVGADELHRAILSATLFLQARDRPGLIACGLPPDGLVPVWTSEASLARSLGATTWLSTSGADLLDLLPPGYDLLLDPDGPTALRLRPSAVRPRVVVTVGWR